MYNSSNNTSDAMRKDAYYKRWVY